jgi:hypothetical protein
MKKMAHLIDENRKKTTIKRDINPLMLLENVDELVSIAHWRK